MSFTAFRSSTALRRGTRSVLLPATLVAACAGPAREAEPATAGSASSAAAGTQLPAGHWVVVARRNGTAVLAAHPIGARDVERPGTRAEPTALEVLIHEPGETARPATAELLPLVLPGVPPEQARAQRVGRVRVGGRYLYFPPPAGGPSLLASPADPDLYLFDEANALWVLTAGQAVRRLSADRVGEFDRAALAARQREGEVILYWAAAPVWSPDGRTIAYVTNREAVAGGRAGQSIWLLELATRRERPLLNEPGESFRPIGWLGRELLFTGPPGIGAIDPATGARRQLAFGLELAVTADGSAVAVADNVPVATRVQVLSAAGARTVPPAPPGTSYAAQALFSPGGGRLLLLATTADGRGRQYFVYDRDPARLTPVRAPAGQAADWPSWLDDDTLLLPTIDPASRAVTSWVVPVGSVRDA